MLGRPFWIFGHFLFGIFCLCPNVLHDFTNTYGRISFNFGRIFYLFYNVIKQIQIWKLEITFNYSCSDVLFLRRFVYKSKYKKCRYKNLFFQILWKSRCNILVSFPSHLNKLLSILRFLLEKLNYGLSKFQCRK